MDEATTKTKVSYEPHVIASPYWHWMIADGFDYHVRRSLLLNDPTSGKPRPVSEEEARMTMLLLMMQPFYALLYVAIEAYQKSSVHDGEIDIILSNTDMIDKLRRFRNAVFHPQSMPLGPKIFKFLAEDESEKWITDLKRAFRRFYGGLANEAIARSGGMTEEFASTVIHLFKPEIHSPVPFTTPIEDR